jgi:tRNA (mo5U34)-methyltransferase
MNDHGPNRSYAAPVTLAEDAAKLVWYHTIDLPGGVTTAGRFDVRGVVPKLPLPTSLAGRRCLDVGTCDGFWAFELERRGADEVVAIDIGDLSERDLTVAATNRSGAYARAKATFALAHEALGSRVEFRPMNVYDLDPAEVGTFDFVFMGSLLLHLRDPVRALAAVRSVCRGQLLSHDSISPMLSLLAPRTPAALLHGTIRQEWWIPNKAGRRREIEAAGFRVLGAGRTTWEKRRGRVKLKALRRRPFSTALLAVAGVPHQWVLAEPDAAAPAFD